MHLGHVHLVDLGAVDVELALAAGDPRSRAAGLDEVELDVHLAARQRRGLQRVVEPVVVVVVVVDLVVLDVQGVAAGEAAAGDDDALFRTAQIERSLDAVGTAFDRRRRLLGDASGPGGIVDELCPVAEESALLLGTRGVSLYAQQFCQLMGARTIVMSSSDSKLERIQSSSAWDTINYRETVDWDSRVVELTDGAGADRVIEVGGPGTLQKSIGAVRVGGIIALIGILTGVEGAVSPTNIMRKSIIVQGIYVGSRQMFVEMNKAISLHKMKPVIDEEFEFSDARAAYHRMRGAQHFGKLVISVG